MKFSNLVAPQDAAPQKLQWERSFSSAPQCVQRRGLRINLATTDSVSSFSEPPAASLAGLCECESSSSVDAVSAHGGFSSGAILSILSVKLYVNRYRSKRQSGFYVMPCMSCEIMQYTRGALPTSATLRFVPSRETPLIPAWPSSR